MESSSRNQIMEWEKSDQPHSIYFGKYDRKYEIREIIFTLMLEKVLVLNVHLFLSLKIYNKIYIE